MNSFRIFNLLNPSGPQQPATKNYVDQKNTQQDIAINSKQKKMKYSFLMEVKV